MGAAGTHLPTEPPSNMLSPSGQAYSPENVCGTQKVAWMEGSHPKVQDGIVVRNNLKLVAEFYQSSKLEICVGEKILLPMVKW